LIDRIKTIARPWRKVKERSFKMGHRNVIVRTFELPDGREVDFELFHAGGIVCIFPLTPDNNVVLARQFRAGPNRVLPELPGGMCEPDETPEQSAARELAEETGYTGDLEFVGSTLLGAYTIGERHNFVATNCRRTQEQQLDDNEFIESIEMPLDQFMKLLRSGQLSDVTTGYLCLDHLGLL